MIFSIICEGAGAVRRHCCDPDFFAVDLASDDCCEQRVGSVRCAVSCRRAGAYRDSGHFKCCGRNELNAEHRRVPAVYQLRRLIDSVFLLIEMGLVMSVARGIKVRMCNGVCAYRAFTGSKEDERFVRARVAAVQLHLSRIRHLCHSIG